RIIEARGGGQRKSARMCGLRTTRDEGVRAEARLHERDASDGATAGLPYNDRRRSRRARSFRRAFPDPTLDERPAMTATAEHSERLEFKTELKQLLHIITHSLYSNKEIFLRELISNASDAINKIAFDSLQHEEKLEGNKSWKIEIIPDREKNTLTVRDNGVGLSREEAVENLGTIARSGTRLFLERLKAQAARQRPELIGQSGVGFSSPFMVADRVTVISRPAGEPKNGVRWESDGQGEFTVESVEKPTRGTDVILQLKEEDRD